MKLFGEYLVEKGLIDNDKLAAALVYQIKGLPSITEIVFEQKLIKSDDFLRVLKKQSEEGNGFVDAALHLNLWNSQIGAQVEKNMVAKRSPLGQVLVHLGFAKIDQIAKALDNYFADHPGNEQVIAVAAGAVSGSAGATQDISIDTNMVPTPLSQVVSNAFLLEFGGKFYDLLNTHFSNPQEKLSDKATLKKLIIELHRVRGAARLVRATSADSLLSGLEELLNVISKSKTSSIGPELWGKTTKVLSSVLALLWDLRSKIAKGETELGDAMKASLQEELAAIEVLKFDFDFVEKDS